MRFKCDYNETKDLNPVDQFGYIDLVECFQNNTIPAELSDAEMEYNEIDDPTTIMGKPSDNFEAIRMNQYIHDNGTIKDEPTNE